MRQQRFVLWDLSKKDVTMRFALSLPVAGLVANLVAFSSSVALIFQAANSMNGANMLLTGSWLFALCLGSGLSTLILSLWYRQPVLTAWSTPGAALLISSLQGVTPSLATGAFLFSALLIMLSGVTGIFARLMHKIPTALASAMLAGVLVRFGMKVFEQLPLQPWLITSMLLVYLLAKRLYPRYAILLVLIAGGVVAWQQNLLQSDMPQLTLVAPVLTWPVFDMATLLGIGLPLFIVTMASQNLPGIAVIRANGYPAPVSASLTVTGVINLILAPLGCFAINLAAITAAICMGPEAHEDPAQRYKSAVFAGIFYLIAGIFGASIVALFGMLPAALIMGVAGIALFGTIGASLHAALHDAHQREAALLTFLVTASGLTLWGIGSAFWGLVAGIVVMMCYRSR
ncbi:benzoate/H(+) symporter BenE family transporter [Tolumonas osonensis]|uniref:Benzoate membrane transport protein n=1 Tax=Tolumonas osonensis TaxID=675874 RepID=A0A841GAD7_9GAMM|nr:benzoate/H(+) symporter BenE family transporter [Tolumonas osonensis]MBB6056018.1 benzoate membrane transport protein [Tolumonas osonensis]